ncbi:aminoacyl-tRNA hydrolase [Mycoplasma miroungirhinis]|uniref:Peptidyl-tRNA hydrolase n=1 Tax=Mycoplasma miroungirhinis TaxID=754516 RepID=A0A6M4JE17_9MOLU|nr:aminoacyl-tRNA hydrolase [Mycoplasma miroungirhinis]QJR44326.1 aminoacyl-tRNA hydrolase [Mycoplasma miroungirhinis]
MKLIIGLGNPGEMYNNTRHNIGFAVIDNLVKKLELDNGWKEKFKGEFVKGEDFIIAKPLTYMNLSGDFVQQIVQFFKISTNDIIVVYDDMDHAVGKAVVKTTGSAGGHNGMADIINKLNTKELKRLKIGIGRPIGAAKDYVLAKIPVVDQEIFNKTINRSVEFLETFLFNDIRFAITQFNTEVD